MRKWFWCGMAGALVLVSVYRGGFFGSNRPDSDVSSCVSCGCDPATLCDDQAACRQCVCPYAKCGQSPLNASNSDNDAPVPPSGPIALGKATVTEAIYIPESDEPTNPIEHVEAPPEVFDFEFERVAAPALMPICDGGDEAPAYMPYADEEVPRQFVKPAAVTSGFFDEEAPIDETKMPECREDGNLQYPGCPIAGGAVSASKTPGRKAASWQHNPNPILPIPPVGADDSGSPSMPKAPRKHTSFKFPLSAGDKEPSPRQTVDTLELRPSDLPREPMGHEPL